LKQKFALLEKPGFEEAIKAIKKTLVVQKIQYLAKEKSLQRFLLFYSQTT